MKVENLGCIPYLEALNRQTEHMEKVIAGEADETIFICSHNPVVTLGKKSEPSDVAGWQGEVYQISRGGKATYHGPGQIVVYPIVNLAWRQKDIYQFLRTLETATVRALGQYGISAFGNPSSTGVWVGTKKIASLGVAIKKWVTYHGLAINLEYDPQAFRGIRPCGFDSETMTSVEEVLGKKVSRAGFEKYLIHDLSSRLLRQKSASTLHSRSKKQIIE